MGTHALGDITDNGERLMSSNFSVRPFCYCHVILHFFNFFNSLLPSIQSGFGKQRKQSLISFILCICFCLELHDCYYFTV